MQLPEYERVIYERNPLVEVVCELKFPVTLKITTEIPTSFQQKIQAAYPTLRINYPVEIPEIEIPQKITSEFKGILKSLNEVLINKTNYAFLSEDNQWQVVLSNDAITLATKNYVRYEDFKARLEFVIQIFEEIYKPISYTQLDLKYQNLIIPSKLGIDSDWKLLIKKPLIPELYSDELSASVKAMRKQIYMDIGDASVVLDHGIVTVNDNDIYNEFSYLIQTDYLIDKKILGIANVLENLDKFSNLAGKLFRWAITDQLHNLLKPQPVSTN